MLESDRNYSIKEIEDLKDFTTVVYVLHMMMQNLISQ